MLLALLLVKKGTLLTMSEVVRAYEQRLRRQLSQHPHLQNTSRVSGSGSSTVSSTQEAAVKRFISECKGLPFWLFSKSTEEHDRLRIDTNGNCCFICKIGRPLKNSK